MSIAVEFNITLKFLNFSGVIDSTKSKMRTNKYLYISLIVSTTYSLQDLLFVEVKIQLYGVTVNNTQNTNLRHSDEMLPNKHFITK